jgi:flagellar assembly protein FliH
MTLSSSRPAVHLAGAHAASASWAPTDLTKAATPPSSGAQSPAAAAAAAAHAEKAAIEAQLADAYAQGFEEGRIEGEHSEQARLRNAVAAAQEALDTLRDGEARWMGTIEENVCALAVAVARHVIARDIVLDPTVVPQLVQKALDEFPVDQPLRIRVNPQDLHHLQRADDAGDPIAALTPGREARWVPDHSIAPGGCIVEGRERIVDGRVDTALERLYRRLTYTDA